MEKIIFQDLFLRISGDTMKKWLTVFIILIVCIIFCVPFFAFAQDSTAESETENPVLLSISFKNAEIEPEFDANIHEYTLKLEYPSVSPSLDDYKIRGDANIFVNYETDETKHPTGILVTLEHKNGSDYYSFKYKNANNYAKNSNNLLAEVYCELGEIYPKLNDEDTEYKLYIPSDLKTINLSAVTKDVSAYCELPGSVSLNTNQDLNLSATVYASDGAARTYTFEVKRIRKTSNQIKAEMNDPNYKSMIDGELFYQKPVFAISIVSTIAGLALFLIFIKAAKRLTVRPCDDDETEFFDFTD